MVEIFSNNREPESLWIPILVSVIVLVAAWVVGVWVTRTLRRIMRRQLKTGIDNVFNLVKTPLKLLLVSIAVSVLNHYFQNYWNMETNQLVFLLLVFIITWLGIAIIKSIKHFVLAGYDMENENNLKARKMHTQMRVFERIMIFLIVFISLAVALLSFEKIREIGLSLLASAGIAGLILGFAAQKSLSLLLAGFQIAITQPIRLEDAVIVEGEWGWIEEITLTYVVIRIWDKRRLVVPINYFIEKPFQNWTRHSAEIMGTVFIYVDYGFPVEAMREEMKRILPEIPEWDGNVNVLQVTNCTEKTMELRALVSASNSPRAWDLRVRLREELIAFLQREYPQYLPKARITLEDDNKNS
ncbi:mechanosensitive ion channel family protein [Marinilabilia salmonicolor]|jgi:small-conductance mechanosensitive channel|uniref:Small-conductance mechanosensitive channel n=1 Tax=Marinilabilia salmonicolor TaxID=989 RepID=A0A2T0XMF4_9BACT|nr:mechanosensitive ion channel family protein [Marinilabilia salmonicolor]PRZ00106.1 small-conductance mechanosensitive channel [Marinilabilia salmonicolor]RCW38732.1 small-conductance mechanosensitive channel [Marinilabilia salmonicolor]